MPLLLGTCTNTVQDFCAFRVLTFSDGTDRAKYLRQMLDTFGGDTKKAVAAYNAGRGNVKAWMDENNWSYSFHDIDAIPYKETRDYVRQVIGDRKKYRELYPE